jgi:hypothetical protein
MKLIGLNSQILCLPERPWLHEHEPPDHCRTDRRRAALGHHGAAVQAGPALAGAGLAHLRALRRGRRDPPPRRPPPAPGRVPARRAGLRWARLRRLGPAAERRDHPDQRHPCRPADRLGPGDGRGDRGGVAARRGTPGRVGGVRPGAGRRRPGHRRPRRRGEHRRGRAGAGVPAGIGHVHGGADAAAGGPGPGRRDRRAVPRRRAGGAAVRRFHRGPANRLRCRRAGSGHRGAGGRRHAAAVRPVRLRAEPGARRGRGGVLQHRAVRRRRGGRGVLRQPGRAGAARRGRDGARRDRAEQPSAAGRWPRGCPPRGGAGVRA